MFGYGSSGDSADYPELNDQGEFSLMGTLADHGWHDLQDERWNIYGQGTYIGSYQPSFPAAYTNLNGTPNSLLPNSAYGFTATVTIYAGFKAWQGRGVLLCAGNDFRTAVFWDSRA